MSPVEDFKAHRPHYDILHIIEIAANCERLAIPYCWECHDWHSPNEDHSMHG